MILCRTINLVWFQGIHSAPKEWQTNPDRWRELNPGWEVRVWDYRSLADFIRAIYPAYFERWGRLDRIIKKCDFARLLLIHHFGGVYADLDLTPRIPLDDFLSATEVFHRRTEYTSVLPEPAPVEALRSFTPHTRFEDFDFILSKEHRPIDEQGYGVANGILIATKRRLPVWIDFAESRINHPRARVLDFVGTWAFTNYLRKHKDEIRGKGIIIPPYYFLWEPANFSQPPPPWCVTLHPAQNSWGDHSQEKWWET